MSEVITTRSPAVTEILEQKRRDKEYTEVERSWMEIREQRIGVGRVAHIPQPGGTSRFFHEVMPDGSWKGQRCFIIGGGPSLRGFDFSRLQGELTIGINRAYEKIDCTIMFASDRRYYEWIMKGDLSGKAKEKFLNFSGYKVWMNPSHHQYPDDIYLLNGNRREGLSWSLKDGLGRGNNSGFSALNLAVCLGANPIYLLGFDMRGADDKQVWWHDGYPEKQSGRVYERFILDFEKIADELRKKSIRVVNLNLSSALRCFEFGEFKDIKGLGTGYEYIATYDSRKILSQNHEDLYFEGCLGFGDNFYQRPIIKELAKIYKTVYLRTFFPEIYWDIPNVKFIYPERVNLWTHKKHIERLSKKIWSKKSRKTVNVRWSQLGPPSERKIQTKYVELENKRDFDFTFPVRNAWIKEAKKLIETLPLKGKKLCIIRRPTNRKEWNCPARNPKIEYYQLLIDKYKDEYFFLSIADIKKGEEWFDGNLKGLDKEFNHGEVPLTTILGLLKIADMIITYPSFFMIAAIAIRAKCFCIFGGSAAPHAVLRKNLGLQNFEYVAPDPFCDCQQMKHNCNKEIPIEKILGKFEDFKNRERVIKTISIGCPPGIGDTHWIMTKMESFKEKNAIDRLKIVVHQDPIHFYTADFLRLIPFIDEVQGFRDTFKINRFYDKDNPGCIAKDIQGVDYLIDFGAKMWLKGAMLSDILPEYETHYDYQIDIPDHATTFAKAMKRENNGKLVLFYTSSIGNNRNWNGDAWKIEDWISLAMQIFNHSGIRPILIGAQWDKDYAEQLRRLDHQNIIQNLVGELGISQTLALLKEANLVVSFACGIPMMAAYFGAPTVIFWAVNGVSRKMRFNPEFQFTWLPPKARENGRYVPIAYDSKEARPEKIFNRIKEFL